MRPAVRALTHAVLALGLATAGGAEAAAPDRDPHAPSGPQPLQLTPCELEHPLRLTAVAAECGWLDVAENPQEPAGRHIRLRVARVPAVSRAHRPDPLFILAGGPGMAATSFYASVAPVFARIHRDRDIVLVDQRGTGASNPLECRDPQALEYRDADAEIAASSARCLASLSARADVRYYTTSVAVQDLEHVRAALGYGRIDLYGSSYGTRVAQQYLRRFGARVRSVILDGVVPVGLAIGPDTPLEAERALAAILARCTGAPACRGRFGDPAATYRSLRARLATRAVPVSVADPTSATPLRLEFGHFQLATVLRLVSYTPEYAALLPLLLDDAAARGDFAPLAAQFLLASREYGEALAVGMHNSVVCTEDVPFYPAAIDRAALDATFLGTAQLDGLAAVCRVWPRGVIDADLHAPLSSPVPALLLSGSDDPVTPPRYASEALRGFAHGRALVLEGFGHGQLTAPCMDKVMQQFIEHAAASVDVSCTAHAVPLAFFTSMNGPPP